MRENKHRNENSILANLVTIAILLMVLGIFVVPLIRGANWYEQAIVTHQQEIESYSPDTYNYLLKCVSLLFREDQKIIDINAKPDDIIIQKIEMQDDGKFLCELYLDKGKENKYIPNANITAELSQDFEILHTSSPYASEEEFINAVKAKIKDDSINEALKIFYTYVFVLAILLLVPWAIINITKSYKRISQQKK